MCMHAETKILLLEAKEKLSISDYLSKNERKRERHRESKPSAMEIWELLRHRAKGTPTFIEWEEKLQTTAFPIICNN